MTVGKYGKMEVSRGAGRDGEGTDHVLTWAESDQEIMLNAKRHDGVGRQMFIHCSL